MKKPQFDFSLGQRVRCVDASPCFWPRIFSDDHVKLDAVYTIIDFTSGGFELGLVLYEFRSIFTPWKNPMAWNASRFRPIKREDAATLMTKVDDWDDKNMSRAGGAIKAQFKLFGGPRHGRIVELNPFIIKQWMAPRVTPTGDIEYDVYTRRELDGIFYYAFTGLDDESAVKLLLAA